MDPTFCLWFLIERQLPVVSDSTYRFRENDKVTLVVCFDRFFDSYSPRSLCIMSSFFLVRHLEFLYVAIGFIRKCRFEIFDNFEDGLLTDSFRGFCQPFFIGYPWVFLGGYEFVPERHLVELVASVDSSYGGIVRVPSSRFKPSQQQFLFFRRVQFDVS